VSRIRPLALAVIRRGEELLVFEAFDTVKRERFARLLGGGIEFGERAEEALRREFREELGAELESVRLLGLLENIFTYEGRPYHELVLVYEAGFVDETLYGHDTFVVLDDPDVPGVWRSPAVLAAAGIPLYPDGLAELLEPR
jgi:8-oxo-dGTP pyrophosphatase MutT (NUDIX family)